jgi:DNA-binding CsgD family transcriptional regulator
VSSFGVSARFALSRLGRPVAPVNTLGGSRVDPLGHPVDAIGMDAFGERPRRKLVATSETVRKPSPEKRKVLTAQEEQIGRLARDGLSNPEISGQIFITARTVEWHLRKEFTKLGIRDSLASKQTLVRGPGAHWSGSEVPGHSRRQGLDALLRARHAGAVSPRSRELRLVLIQVSGVAPRVVPACPWKAGSAPRSR